MITPYVVFDIETDGLLGLFGDRVTCICAKNNNEQWFAMVKEDEESLILEFLSWLYDHDPTTHTIVTHNGKAFDATFLFVRLALLQKKATHFGQFLEYKHFDSLHEYNQKFGRFISLNKLAIDLGLGVSCQKSGTGLDAIRWWNTGEHAKILDYCKRDVEVTEAVFLKLNGAV